MIIRCPHRFYIAQQLTYLKGIERTSAVDSHTHSEAMGTIMALHGLVAPPACLDPPLAGFKIYAVEGCVRSTVCPQTPTVGPLIKVPQILIMQEICREFRLLVLKP